MQIVSGLRIFRFDGRIIAKFNKVFLVYTDVVTIEGYSTALDNLCMINHLLIRIIDNSKID